MGPKLLLVGSLTALSVTLVGCGGNSSGGVQRVTAASAANPLDSPAWSPSPAASGETVFPGLGVRYRPTDETASVSATDAMKVAQDTPFGHIFTVAPTAILARATDDDWPPGTTSAHHDENVLAWVVSWLNTPPAGEPTSTRPANCDAVVLVDATKGSLLATFQQCPAP